MSEVEFAPQKGPKSFVAVWRKVTLDPRAFYQEMPASGGFENPLIFLGICGLLYLIFKIVVGGLFDAVNATFLVCLVYIFGPGILMLACQYLFQGEGNYEGTLRVWAYAGACLTLAWLPTLGIVAFLYGLYLIFLGTENVHKLDATRAAIATIVGVLVTTAVMLYVLGPDRIRHPLQWGG